MWVDQGVAGQGTRQAEAAMSPTSCPSSRPETALNHTVAETALNHTVDSWLQFMIVHNTLHCLMRPRLVIPSPPPLSETSRSRGVSNFLSPSPSSPLLKGLRWCSTLLQMYWCYSLLIDEVHYLTHRHFLLPSLSPDYITWPPDTIILPPWKTLYCLQGINTFTIKLLPFVPRHPLMKSLLLFWKTKFFTTSTLCPHPVRVLYLLWCE